MGNTGELYHLNVLPLCFKTVLCVLQILYVALSFQLKQENRVSYAPRCVMSHQLCRECDDKYSKCDCGRIRAAMFCSLKSAALF